MVTQSRMVWRTFEQTWSQLRGNSSTSPVDGMTTSEKIDTKQISRSFQIRLPMPSPFSVREVVVVWAAGGIHFVPIPRKGWWGWWGGGTWCRVVIWYPKHLDGKTLVVPSASHFDLEHFFNAPAALARRMLGLVLRHWKNFPDSEKTFPVDPSGMFGETPRMF